MSSKIERRDGVCIGYKDDLHPEDGRGRLENLALIKLYDSMMPSISYTMDNPCQYCSKRWSKC